MTTGYVRPAVPVREFHDALGRRIDYGHRWGEELPPEDTYSVTTHPERFAPLHAVAGALVDHLVATYRVEVTDDPTQAGDDPRLGPARVVRAVRLVPDAPGTAAVTVILTSFPSVLVRAGLLHTFPYPDCGCDACDEDWAGQADQLEQHLHAIAAGEYREFVLPGPELWVGHAFTAGADDLRSGRRTADSPEDRARVEDALERGLPRRWAPWPRRS